MSTTTDSQQQPTPGEQQQPAAPAGEEQQQQAPAPNAEQQQQADEKPQAEAAKYRTRLRAAEAERDELRAHVTELQGEVVRQLLVGRLADPADFDQIGVAAVLGDDGRIDKTKVDEAVTQLLEKKPHYAPASTRPRTRPQPRAGTPVDKPSAAAAESKLQRAFPKGDARWSQVIGKGERAQSTEARSGRVRSEVSRSQDQ
jgi:pyruvate/2-oxoglutarate dehydrogenase complex dihydrolipoamide acyltransferase (E2) component